MSIGENILLGIGYGEAFGRPFQSQDYNPMCGAKELSGRPCLGDAARLAILTTEVLMDRPNPNDFKIEDHEKALHELLERRSLHCNRINENNSILARMVPLVLWQQHNHMGWMSQQLRDFAGIVVGSEQSLAAAERWGQILFHGPMPHSYTEADIVENVRKYGTPPDIILDIVEFCYLAQPDFPQNIHYAVRFGAGADIICAMLGALSAIRGTFQQPEDIKKLKEYWRLRYYGAQLDNLISNLA